MKNRIILSVSLVLAQFLAVNAFAQAKGEADPATAKAVPSKPATAAEKAAAKAARKAEGKKALAAKIPENAGEKGTGVAKAATKEERAEAAKKRKASAAAAVKKGEISSGEK